MGLRSSERFLPSHSKSSCESSFKPTDEPCSPEKYQITLAEGEGSSWLVVKGSCSSRLVSQSSTSPSLLPLTSVRASVSKAKDQISSLWPRSIRGGGICDGSWRSQIPIL